MSRQVMLPEAAPFTVEQRAWLSGFFSGLVTPAGSESPSVQTIHNAPAEETPWHDPAMPMDERLELAQGKSPASQMMAAMAQLDCGACGYVCDTYSHAIAEGAEKDLTRCTPGGKPTAAKLKELVVALSVNGSQSLAKKKVKAPIGDTAKYTRDNPFPARLVQAMTLNRPRSEKDVRHVVIDLRGSGIHYKVGDALGVFPENDPVLVDELITLLGWNGAEDVETPQGETISLRSALLHQVAFARPGEATLELLASVANDAQEKLELHDLAKSGLADDDSRHLVDILKQYPSVKPTADKFVASLPTLQPRLYSISSSLLAHPNQVHLTVGVVRYTNTAGRACRGVASSYLVENIKPGETVRVFVHPSHKFGLPGDRNAPVIMVGPGTGIAPFRAFLQERRMDRHPGKNWLFFGDQRSETDFLYRDELQKLQEEGVLSRLDVAFSRDQAEKIYVQNRMVENGAELWKWLDEGACFYVCGDAKRMTADVDKALKQIITTHGNRDGSAYVAEMIKAGRYQRDVY